KSSKHSENECFEDFFNYKMNEINWLDVGLQDEKGTWIICTIDDLVTASYTLTAPKLIVKSTKLC
ncbi:MAG: hypothetical protein RSD98_13320, partial [Niameybacter sp.]